MLTLEIREEPPSSLAEYAAVPIAFEVRERLAVSAPGGGLAGLHLASEPVQPPYVKDYDAAPGNHPTTWARRFDLAAGWGVLAAYYAGERAGGAVVVCGTPGVARSAGLADGAVLWDLRVAPRWRGRGMGTALFEAAAAWARARGAAWLEAETQDVNAAGCRFYARRGCVLRAIDRCAYPELPGETQLLWRKALAPDDRAG